MRIQTCTHTSRFVADENVVYSLGIFMEINVKYIITSIFMLRSPSHTHMRAYIYKCLLTYSSSIIERENKNLKRGESENQL